MELKELRKRLKKNGYKIRTKKLSSLSEKRFADVYKDGEFIVGSSASAYPAEIIKNHKPIFDLYNQARKEEVTDKGEKIIL